MADPTKPAHLPLIAESLRGLQKAIETARSGNNDPIQRYGWSAPGLTPRDMEKMVEGLADLVEAELPFTEDEDAAELLEEWPAAINHIATQTVPQLMSGNAPAVATAFVTTIFSLRMALSSLLGWTELRDRAKMPISIRKRLAGLESSIDSIIPDAESLSAQVEAIKEAADAANDLPVSLSELKRARAQIAADVDEARAKSIQILAALQSVNDAVVNIEAAKNEADTLVAKVRESQRITTSIGLASAFDERARRLGSTLTWWVVLLFAALTGAAVLTAFRWAALSKLAEGEPNWPAVALQLFLSALSLAGPAWLGWLATKQIGQRFKLAEDYAFKASVAKAYEGYRREAEALGDPEMASRLFNSALTRLDEAPLRFVEPETHGSPWHEFANTVAFKEAAKSVPGFVESYRRASADGVPLWKRRSEKNGKRPVDPGSGTQDTEQ